MTNFCKIFILHGILFVYMVHGHVRLTWPPARYPPLDFLDNTRTSAPCGVPKPRNDKGARTSFKAGSTINVTWSLTYPHQGGFRLEMLNESDHIQDVLTSEQLEYVSPLDPIVQSFQLTLPDKPCRNCAIRLLRQATEWGTYKFWSCADIDIESNPTERCSNHGLYVNKKCQCERTYNGDVCQYQDECLNDQDCGGNGKCIELDVFHYPRRLCYCRPGWFGTGCQQESKIKTTQFDASLYQYRSLADGENKLYWRIMKETNEIEFVMQYYGKSWVAVGWRPRNVDPQCTNLSKLASKIFSKSFTEPLPNSPEPAPSPHENSGLIITSTSTHPPTTTHEAMSTTEDLGDDDDDVTDSTVKNGESDVPKSLTVLPEAGSRSPNGFNIVPSLNVSGSKGSVVVVTPNSTVIPEESIVTDASGGRASAGTDDVAGELCYGDWRWPPDCRECDYRLSWTYVDEYDDIEFSLETRVPSNWWSGVGFSKTGKMSDADMIIVKSLDSKILVQDMHSRGYAEPILDAKQDVNLPNIVGTHLNGLLRASFSRNRHTSETDEDVQFSDTNCFYFLFPVGGGRLDAKGKMAQHLNTPKVSKQKICVKSCAAGGATASVEEQTTCQKEFKFPVGCQLPACDYYATWNYNPEKEVVNFQISSKEIGRWTGIGFSTTGNMTNSDMILGWVYDNGTYVTDRFAYGKHQPAIDRHQDIEDVRGRVDDDIQTIFFSRKLETDDVTEDLSLLDCLYYLFPVGGGRVLAKSSEDLHNVKTPIGFHDLYVPKVSRTPICICTDDGYPLFALNETSALRREKRKAVQQTTTPDYDDDYADGTDPTPLPNATESYQRSVGGQKPSTKLPIKAPTAATKEPSPAPTKEPSPMPTKEPSTITTKEPSPVVPSKEPSPLPTVQPSVQPKLKQPDPSQSGGQGLSGEFGDAVITTATVITNEEVSKESLHPMDCTDIIIGSAVGGLSKVEDYYTISRATPMVDEIYGGRQSITAAIGSEENDVTTIIFRRKLTTSDPADHSITDTVMSVIWAKGQDPDHYSHNPKSGLEQTNNKHFYSPDVLAYHGTRNRGQFSANFFDKADPDPLLLCRGEQSYPPGCLATACLYNLTWTKVGGNMNFIMDVKMNREQWTGVGFSKDGAMAKSDSILIQVNPTGPVEVTDRFMPGYSRPIVDRIQNIFNVDARYVNGRMSAAFTRALLTDDAKEDLDLNECFYFLYPFKGGSVVNGEIQKHNDTPGRSEQICFATKCANRLPVPGKKPNGNIDGSPIQPVYKKYLLVMKLLNFDWTDDLFESTSDKYKSLSNKILGVVDKSLTLKFQGYQKSELTKLRPGSVIADVTVTASGLNEKDILDTIQGAARSGLTQGLRMDPDTISVREIKDHLSPEEIRNYVIIAIAGFLVIIAIISGVCLIVYIRKRRRLQNSAPMMNEKHLSAYQFPTSNAPISEKKAYDNRSYNLDYTPSHRAHAGLRPSYSAATMSTPNDGGSSIMHGHLLDDKRDYQSHHASQQNLRRPSSRTESSHGKHGQQKPHSQYHSTSHQAHHASSHHSHSTAHQDRRRKPPSLNRQGYSYQQDSNTNGTGSPYVQYPNEPTSYYTMNGVNRVQSNPNGNRGYFGQY